MMDDHVGQVEAARAGRARAQVPLALRLIAKRAGLATQPVVEQANAIEHLAAVRDVDAERPRDTAAELAHVLAVVEQRDHFRVQAVALGEPGRLGPAPERQHAATDELALVAARARRPPARASRPRIAHRRRSPR